MLIVFGTKGHSPPTGLQRCPSIEDPVARQACHDAAMPPISAATRSLPPQGATASRHATAASVPTDRRAAGAAAFGLPARRDGDELQSIASTTTPGFVQWGPNSRICLDSGQVWQVVDGSSGARVNEPATVTITQGVWGAYFMTFGERNFSPKVRRVESTRF